VSREQWSITARQRLDSQWTEQSDYQELTLVHLVVYDISTYLYLLI
jgi:hypothetical protein